MKIVIKREAELQFSVECPEDCECFGKPVDSLEEAVELYCQAKVMRSGFDWVIVCRPKVEIKNELFQAVDD